MEKTDILEGKEEVRQLNGHRVVVVVPNKRISYEEGVKRLEKLFERIQKRASD